MKRAIVLLSGGLDSTVAMAIALDCGREVLPLSFNYNQRHKKELEHAAKVVERYKTAGAPVHDIHTVSLGGLTLRSSLTDQSIAVPSARLVEEMAEGIPVTYVPARNSTFLAIASGFAETLNADEIWTGFNQVDYSGYPDCRPEYVAAMQEALRLGTKRGVEGNPIEIVTPIINLKKTDIVRRGQALNAPLELTWSCYAGGETPCGVCDSCIIRDQAFAEVQCTNGSE